MTHVSLLRAEHGSTVPFVAVPRPRITWKVATTTPDWRQGSAELQWTSGRAEAVEAVDGDESSLVSWPFPALEPRQRGELRVRVTGVDGVQTEWSEPIELVAGWLGGGEWAAEFVGLANPPAHAQPFFSRCEFDVDGEVRAATLYATAHGVYQAEFNGIPVDDQVLKPGWTSYQYRLIHETTDVLPLLREGRNAIGATVAGGWFTESYGFQGRAKPFYGDQPSFAAQLVIEYADGRVQHVVTDGQWRAFGAGPTLSSGIYAGESYDAGRQLPGWSDPGFDDAAWPAAEQRRGDVVPSARTSPIVRAIEELAVVEVITSPTGKTILDFGQNLVGRLRIRVSGPAGHEVVLRHAEVLEHGELGVRPLRAATATDRYRLAGGGVELWEPAFTFHGFRYAEIDGWPGELDPADIVAVVIHSDMERTGWFSTSDPLVDRLHENVVWGMRGNFLYLPTDCPQRDERLGWTGDIQVFTPTACYLYDCDSFLASWLEDLALEQQASGGVPFIVPDVLHSADKPAAAWGDAATIVPSVLYERFGDLGVLATQFASMCAWVDQLLAVAGERHLWEGGFQFGDWLDPDAPPDRPGDAKADNDLVASAHLYRSTDLVARAARVLGHDDLADHYEREAETIRSAWLDEYTTAAARIVSDAQTAYALAIMFEIERDPERLARIGDRLAWLVRRDGYRIGTGFVGTPLVTDALVRTGHLDAATRLLMQTESPSWLYPVSMGATTIWERWDSMLEDGSINPGEMTSFNHYAFGAIADWLHRSVAGLGPAEPGYRVIAVAPHPIIGLEFATTEHETPYGRAAAGWREGDNGSLVVTAAIPPNCRALVRLPGSDEEFEVGSGDHEWTVTDPRTTPAVRAHDSASSLAEIIDDPEVYETVWRAMERIDPEQARSFRRNTDWVAERALSEAFMFVPPQVADEVERALAELNSRRPTLR